MYNCSGKPFVRPDISGPLGLTRLLSEFEVVAPNLEEDVRKTASIKSSLTAALESLILSNLHCGFVFGAVVYYPRFCRSCQICS